MRSCAGNRAREERRIRFTPHANRSAADAHHPVMMPLHVAAPTMPTATVATPVVAIAAPVTVIAVATVVTPVAVVPLPVALLDGSVGDAGHASDSQTGCRTDRDDLHTRSLHPRIGLTEADEPQPSSGPTRLVWSPGGERPLFVGRSDSFLTNSRLPTLNNRSVAESTIGFRWYRWNDLRRFGRLLNYRTDEVARLFGHGSFLRSVSGQRFGSGSGYMKACLLAHLIRAGMRRRAAIAHHYQCSTTAIRVMMFH